MSRVIYIDGAYVPAHHASVSWSDRGHIFADGVYEVWAVVGGVAADWQRHVARLRYSLEQTRLGLPISEKALAVAARETIRRNRIAYGMLYLHLTRGAARRDHPFPQQVRPSLSLMAQRIDFQGLNAKARRGISVKTLPDMRWGRVDIKSISLLPNVLAKQAARDVGAYEAWLLDTDGMVTEGTSTNAWIVTWDGTLVTRPLGADILAGITRQVVLEVAAQQGFRVEERAFSVQDAKAARECFTSSATVGIMPVTAIDGDSIGNGAPGEITETLLKAYRKHLADQAPDPEAALAALLA